MIADSDDTHEFEELDPSGRYGRYKDVLGTGTFKIVYKGFDIVEGIEVAWNQIKVQNARHSTEDIEQFYSEVHLLKTLKHKNIIKFYHSWVDSEAMNINFLTEIFTSGTLRQYRKKHKRIDIRALKKWSRQILRGLLYLHSQDPPVLHRDLKCDNIFINGNQGEVKIGDLGLATILNQAHAAQSVIGTPEFMAPELYEGKYSELVDIYSFGMCILEMVTGEYPYSECTNAVQIYKKVTTGKGPAALNKIKSYQLYHFVEKCIAPASRRSPARELLMDPFLQDEVFDISRETRSIHNSSDGVKLSRHSFSDIHLPSMDQSWPSLESFWNLGSRPSLPVMQCQDYRDKVDREMDMKIKGKRRENGTLQLRLQIAIGQGQVRVIHFPFDVGKDTAMSVAKEMITELDLVDQDVTKIAKVFDDAIRILVPKWHMGSTTESSGEDPRLLDAVDVKPSMPGPHKHPKAAHKSAEMEPTMHGRFEEIAYRRRGAAGLPPVAKDKCDENTSTLSVESWENLITPSLDQSLNAVHSFKSSPFI